MINKRIGEIMNNQEKGKFSKDFLSLQLQFKTLLEEAGGKQVEHLLDLLTLLSNSEKEILIKIFCKNIKRLLTKESRLELKSDKELKELEDNLYSDIIANLGAIQRDCISLKLNNQEKKDSQKAKKVKENKIISIFQYKN